jgi:NhaA family Na+:H+ antiporter
VLDKKEFPVPLPARTPAALDRVLNALQEFLRLEAAGGLVLMAAAAVALVISNSPVAPGYAALLDLPLEVRLGNVGLAKPLSLWINDGLMAVFFLLVGLELKREVMEGHLSSLRQASLPAVAALGGMAVPAALYAVFNRGDAVAMKAWAIPTATDIAFALGVLSLLGKRVPTALKAFLLSVAIFDDLGAIVVIAVFYTAKLSALSLLVAALLTLGLAALNRFGVRSAGAYFVLGVPLWVAVLESGVHATLAGVVLAMFIPLRPAPGNGTSRPSPSLLRQVEHALHPWVAFGVLPVFALANAGVPIVGLSIADAVHPVPLGIAAGLLIGKQAGILAACWLATRLRLAALPEAVNWRQLHGVALLCGIGFTMSLFVASLAFEPGDGLALGRARVGILEGTLASGLLGYLALRLAVRGGKNGA